MNGPLTPGGAFLRTGPPYAISSAVAGGIPLLHDHGMSDGSPDFVLCQGAAAALYLDEEDLAMLPTTEIELRLRFQSLQVYRVSIVFGHVTAVSAAGFRLAEKIASTEYLISMLPVEGPAGAARQLKVLAEQLEGGPPAEKVLRFGNGRPLASMTQTMQQVCAEAGRLEEG